jgi:hypothetical protein
MIKFGNALSISVVLFISLASTSCNRISETSKEVINKTGETVGKGVSEFAKGVEEGVSKSYECKLEVSEQLSNLGLRTSKFRINKITSNNKNTLSVYCMFIKDFKQNLLVKVIDANGNEYGRVKQSIQMLKGEAQFFDFIFDDKVDIEDKSTFIIDLAN